MPTIGFTGHVNDVDTDLTYMQQRYYDPVAGRFLSIDPVTTDANTGSSFNRYAYAANNPYKYVDPDGREIAISGKTQDINSYRALAYKFSGIQTKVVGGSLVQVGQRNSKIGEAGAAKALTDAIKSKDTIAINVVNKDKNVFVDSFYSNKVDVADMQATANQSGKFGAALFTHVLVERTFDAANNKGFEAAHTAATSAESSVMGASNRTNMGAVGPGSTVWFDYKDSAGKTTSSFELNHNKNMELH